MIEIDIERMPPPGLERLDLGDAVTISLHGASHVAYLCHRQAVISMPVVAGPDRCAVIYEGVLLAFAFTVPRGGQTWSSAFEPPIYTCIVPSK